LYTFHPHVYLLAEQLQVGRFGPSAEAASATDVGFVVVMSEIIFIEALKI